MDDRNGEDTIELAMPQGFLQNLMEVVESYNKRQHQVCKKSLPGLRDFSMQNITAAASFTADFPANSQHFSERPEFVHNIVPSEWQYPFGFVFPMHSRHAANTNRTI